MGRERSEPISRRRRRTAVSHAGGIREGGRSFPLRSDCFEDATIGDPEVDLLPVRVEAGLPVTERMWFYRCRGTLHALLHYVREGKHDEIPAAVGELRRRLDLRPGR
jgi:hypothetical protein